MNLIVTLSQIDLVVGKCSLRMNFKIRIATEKRHFYVFKDMLAFAFWARSLDMDLN